MKIYSGMITFIFSKFVYNIERLQTVSCSKIIGSDYKCTSHPLEIADRRRDLNIRLNEDNYSAQG